MQGKWLLLAVLSLSPRAAAAQAAAMPVADMPVHMTFAAYAAGLNVLNFDAELALSSTGYQLVISSRTTGMVGAFVNGHDISEVQGVWQGLRAMPQRFASHGNFRGTERRLLIDYIDGNPVIRTLLPPPDEEREPVPPDMQRNTIDSLSAITGLVRDVAGSGRCDGDATTFDGRRVAHIVVHTVGQVALEPTSRSSFSGPALECDFEGRQLAGFVRDVDRATLEKPQVGKAWLAQVVPGGPPLPVRLSFHTRFFGQATMYLTSAAAVPAH